MSAVVDMMVKPILMMPPFFTFPPLSTVICGTVELIRGGDIEKIPGLGQIIKYSRETVLVVILLIVLYIKVWQYIGPKLWHFYEGLKWYPDVPPKPSGWSSLSIDDQTDYYFGQFKLFISKVWNWMITTFLQIPIDIMSWDMESLSLDFGNLWASDDDFFRSDCRRFINGSYAGDFSLYEGEKIHEYTGDTYTGVFNDQYLNSDTRPNPYYLCTHGNYCSEMSDIFGRTMIGKNGSLTDDKSPTNGFVNGINITSAPRKYAVCCESVKTGSQYQDCDQLCNGRFPHINIRNPFDNIDLPKIKEIAEHPINTIEEPLRALNQKKFPDDYNAAMCHMHNFFYDLWDTLCFWPFCPQPTGRFSFKKRYEGPYNGCSKSISQIEDDMTRNINILREECKSDCHANNDRFLSTRGCNSADMEKAKRSALRNRNDVLLAQLPTDYEDNKIKDRAIKRTPWKSGERPLGLNPEGTEYNRGQQVKISASLTTDNGTVCSRHDLNDEELDECFGPFKPMTAQQYPTLFYKVTKDFMGSILWTIFIIFIIFIILYILCLFNEVGREAYELNKGTGMIESDMESMGIDKMIK